MRYRVCMDSTEYGPDLRLCTTTLPEAYKGLARLATKCATLNDGVIRTFIIEEVEDEDENDSQWVSMYDVKPDEKGRA